MSCDALRPGKLPGSVLAALLRGVPAGDPSVRLGPVVGDPRVGVRPGDVPTGAGVEIDRAALPVPDRDELARLLEDG